MFKIYIINLKGSIGRRASMEAQLKPLGIDYEFIEATNSTSLSPEYIDSINANKTYHQNLKPGEIGCALSHIHAMSLIAKANYDYGLIIEDDIIINKNLKSILLNLEKSYKEHEVILLCSLIFKPVNFIFSEKLSDSFSLYNTKNYENMFGTQASFLSKSTAKLFSEKLNPVKTISDDWKKFIDEKYISDIRVVIPFPVQHAEFISDINLNLVSKKIPLRTRIKYFFYNRKLFPFYHAFLWNRRLNAEKRQQQNIFVDGKRLSATYNLDKF